MDSRKGQKKSWEIERLRVLEMEDDENGGLFNIEVSSDEEDLNEKVPRDFQSEADFQRVKAEYKPKIEVGEVIFTFFAVFYL